MYEGNSAYSGIDEFAIFEAVSRPKSNPPAPAGMVERLISTDVNELVLQKKRKKKLPFPGCREDMRLAVPIFREGRSDW